MTTNFIRTPENLTEDLLIADGWEFSGFGLFKRIDRMRASSVTVDVALRETLGRHRYEKEGDTLYGQFGDNPNDDQLLEALRVVRLIVPAADKVAQLESALIKIKNIVDASDGRIHTDFTAITKIATAGITMVDNDRNRRLMRDDFKAN